MPSYFLHRDEFHFVTWSNKENLWRKEQVGIYNEKSHIQTIVLEPK